MSSPGGDARRGKDPAWTRAVRSPAPSRRLRPSDPRTPPYPETPACLAEDTKKRGQKKKLKTKKQGSQWITLKRTTHTSTRQNNRYYCKMSWDKLEGNQKYPETFRRVYNRKGLQRDLKKVRKKWGKYSCGRRASVSACINARLCIFTTVKPRSTCGLYQRAFVYQDAWFGVCLNVLLFLFQAVLGHYDMFFLLTSLLHASHLLRWPGYVLQ